MIDATETTGRGLEYFVLDVFTETPLQGNPLAVVINPGTLSTEKMQAIAREMNLSETTFVERGPSESERREGVRVRIFTTQEELPFAGHPTLGTASLLRVIAPEVVVNNTLTLNLNVGQVPVRFEASPAVSLWPAHGEMTQRDPEFGEILDAADVSALTGIAVEEFDHTLPIQIVSTGTAFAIVPLRSAESLASLHVRQEEASAFLRARGARWFYVLGPEAPAPPTSPTADLVTQPAWRARMQFNGGEDPATGSAAGCAISHLVRYGAVPSGATVHVRQGVEMGRPSDLFLSAKFQGDSEEANFTSQDGNVSDVRVGGSTILVAKGHLFLP
jgi:trans-2,3-dihydro-3-hydroxyanthranilate isomerase